MPDDAKYFLKIIPEEGQNAEIQVLEEQHLPRLDYEFDWKAGALADDGCIYYLASDDEGHILKLDPNDGDSLSLVGEEIDEGCEAAVLGNDGYIYGISRGRIIKFNPIDYQWIFVSFGTNLLRDLPPTTLRGMLGSLTQFALVIGIAVSKCGAGGV